MGSGFAKRKKEAKALRESFEEMQNKMKDAQASGSSGNGLVTVTINGDHEITSLKIKPEVVDPEDVEGLEDLVKVAFNQASKKLKEQTESQMPGFPGMPFGF